MDEKFGCDFKPTFRASDLAVFCGNYRENTKIDFLRKFPPFSNLSTSSLKNKRSNPILLSSEEKKMILSSLNENFNNGNLKYNDNNLIEKVTHVKNEFVKGDKEIDELTNESESNLDDEEYLTAESDQESCSIKNDLSETELKIKESQAKRYVTTRRGILLEKHILANVNETEKKKFTKNKEKKIVDFGSFQICGIIDGIDHESRTILEVKTRTKLNFDKNTISSREKIQSMCYMRLFDCEQCYFIEAGPEGVYKSETIRWDKNEFDNILKKLEAFTNEARNLTRYEFEEKLKTLKTK